MIFSKAFDIYEMDDCERVNSFDKRIASATHATYVATIEIILFTSFIVLLELSFKFKLVSLISLYRKIHFNLASLLRTEYTDIACKALIRTTT